MFHIPPVMEEPWLCSGARRLSPVGIFIFQCTIKALPSYSDSFQASVDMKSSVRACERVIKASVSAEAYYRCVLSCRLSSCPSINLARCETLNTEAAFSRSLRTATATLCYPTLGEWAPFGKTNKWSESKLKVAVSFIFFFFSTKLAYVSRLECWHFQFRSTYARWGYSGAVPWESLSLSYADCNQICFSST